MSQTESRLQEAVDILQELDFPRAQLNERSALCLLALLDLKPSQDWSEASDPLMGITPIMDWSREHYGKSYAPNTRETFRRQSMHQFVAAALALYNPDDPGRAVNSPHNVYQIEPLTLGMLRKYGTAAWEQALKQYKEQRQGLALRYKKERDMSMIPVTLADGSEIKLTPGDHSQLIADVIMQFAPRFCPGGELIYAGDTGQKTAIFERERLKQLGVVVDDHGKMPDVVFYDRKRHWLLLIEAVTSHGPVDGKRHDELSDLFAAATAPPVYVTSFPSRRQMAKYVTEISWETEVWISEDPDHLIHFNGDRYLGPHG